MTDDEWVVVERWRTYGGTNVSDQIYEE